MSDVALKEYFERRIEDLDRRIDQRFVLNDRAIAEAREGVNTRLTGMNEFRDALRDQSGRMATRMELETLDKRLQAIERRNANLDGRAAVVSSAISLLITALFWALTHYLK